MEVERRPDAEKNGAPASPDVFCHPDFLLGAPQADPNQVSPRLANSFTSEPVLFVSGRPEGRRIRPDDRHPRESRLEFPQKLFDNIGGAAVEIVFPTKVDSALGGSEQQIRSAHARNLTAAEEFSCPNERHAVRCDQIRAFVYLAKSFVTSCPDDSMHVPTHDIASDRSITNPILQSIQDVPRSYNRNLCTGDVDALTCHLQLLKEMLSARYFHNSGR
jgi:hypothetical protein